MPALEELELFIPPGRAATCEMNLRHAPTALRSLVVVGLSVKGFEALLALAPNVAMVTGLASSDLVELVKQK